MPNKLGCRHSIRGIRNEIDPFITLLQNHSITIQFKTIRSWQYLEKNRTKHTNRFINNLK